MKAVTAVHLRKVAAGLFLAAVTLIYMPMAAAAVETVAPRVVIGGEASVAIVNTVTGTTVEIAVPREAEAVALDDRNAAFWLVDKEGLLLRYGLDGTEQVRVDLRADTDPAAEPAEGASEEGGDILRELLRQLLELIFGNHDFDSVEYAQLIVDKTDGAAWVASGRTLRRYLPDGSLQLEIHPPFVAGAIAFDWHTRQLWVGGENRARAYSADGAFVRDLHAARPISALAFDDVSGTLWAHAHKNLLGFDRAGNVTNTFQPLKLDMFTTGLDGSLWIAKTKTVWHYSAAGDLIAEYDLPSAGPPVNAIAFEANSGGLWLSREKKLQRLTEDGGIATVLDDIRRQDVIAANGDITPPALALLEPADDALVGARPVFRLQVSDTGLGVEPGATRIVIDGERVSADCRWETDGLLACVPVDDVTAFYPGVEIRVADFAGNLSESAGITLRLDTDGDGVEDALDTYPDDPSRHRLAPVTGLAATLQDHAVQLAWQTHADPENAAGYLVFRAAAGSDARMQITPQPISSTTYGDAAIENGNGYVYDVIAVDARGNAGETGEQAELFVAWNDISVDGFTAVRELASGHLAWQASGDLRYRIYRSSGGAEGETGEFAVVQEIDAGTFAWLDESTLWHTAYRYRIATLREFTNVFTNESLVLEGPLSEIVTLAPLPPLGIALNDGHPAADGVREILLINTPVAVSGMYSEARGPVTIAATNEQGGSVTGNFTDGGFRLLLPATAGESWTITVSEQLIADRSVQTSVRFIADTAPPAITLDALAAETDDAFLRITGTIVEDLTGIDTLTAHSDRHASQAFGLVLMEAGHFAGEIPLDNGTNVITVRAVDGAGNAAEAAHSVKRRPPLEPTIEIDAPQDGLVTQQPTVDVSGRVYTGLAADQVRILLGGDVQFPESGDGAEGYSFLFEDVPLREGYNLINVSAETPAGGATASVVITHEPEPPPPVEPAPPELSLSTGSLDIVTNGDSLYIGGSASGDGDLTVTVNGEPVDLIGGNFEYLADLVECVDGSATFAITVTDGNGLSTTETITVECDRAAPLLTVASPGALAAPAVTTLPQNPVLFTGTVTDENLAALTLNGMPVNLAPGANPGEYLFDTPVLLPADLALPVHLEARDTAGNSVARDYLLQVASQVGIEIIAPLPQATYLADGDGVNIAVTARFTNFDPVEHQAFVVANNAAPVVFVMSGNVGNIPVAVPATNDEARISVQVRNLAGNVLASRSVDVGITRAADIELAVSRTEPENNATGIAPIDPVTIYFNKPIDPAKLSITVKETVHGMDYDLSVPQGAGYGDLPEPVLIEIHRDMENVEGNLALYEGDRFVSFHPARRFAYGANIFVDVSYAGEELERLTFQVQSLPTIIAGAVVDDHSQPVPGITVHIPQRNLETVTDSQGNFLFGSAAASTVPIPGGLLDVVINRGLRNPAFGTVTRKASIQFQRTNILPAFTAPTLDTRIPFARIESGQGLVSLAHGNLKLDLSNASLHFPDDRSEGDIHVQFRTRLQASVQVEPALNAEWLYAIQPAGIEVSGGVGIAIRVPQRFGNTDYLPPDGTLVVLLAYSSQEARVRAVGVGKVVGESIVSTEAVQMERLDYIGYSFVLPEKQPVLEAYVAGEIESLDALMQALQ